MEVVFVAVLETNSITVYRYYISNSS